MDLLRICNIVLISVAMGIVGAIAWRLRNRTTIPKYVKYVVIGYLPFAAFALAVTQDALRREAPVTWITWLGTLCGVGGCASGGWSWWSARGQDDQTSSEGMM